MTVDVAALSLSTEDAERVYTRFPELRRGICPTCGSRVAEGLPGTYRWRGEEHECDCQRQLSLAKHYTAAGIGMEFQRLDWHDWHGSESAFEAVHDYLLNYESNLRYGIGLVLWGPVGTGKTFLMYMIAKELVRRCVNTYVSTCSNMVESFTASWGNAEEKAWFARRFMYSDALFLDDVGKEFKSNNRLSPTTFDMILRTRDHDSRATSITTNLDGQQLSFGYGASALSMLQGRNIVIDVSGSDHRVPVGQQRRQHAADQERRPIV